MEATALSDKLMKTIIQREEFIQKNQYYSILERFQEQAGEYYEQCQRFQSTAKEGSSDIVKAHLEPLYKLEKYLKHYFRQLSIAQSLGFSRQLLFSYLATDNYVHLYGAVRNVCSTLEYLGKLLENRLGKGVLDLNDEGLTFVSVYQEVKNQEIDETFAEDAQVRIPPGNDQMEMGDLALSDKEIKFLWSKRNDIVHHCPIVIDGDTEDDLPKELLTTAVLTKSETELLTRLASRTHNHTIGMFLKFSSSYMMEMLEKDVEALHHENPNESD